MTEEKKAQEQEEQSISKSYNQLVYGRYIFMAKVAGVLVLIVLALYFILNRIGKSLGEKIELPTVEEFLSHPERLRARDRVKVQLSLLKDVVVYRKDTVFIVVDDEKYLPYHSKGVYKYPEESMVYGGRLFAFEMMLKRSLLEMQYPFIFTMTVHKDSLAKFNIAAYTKKESAFPLYISPSIKQLYTVTVKDSTVPNGQYEHSVALPDSIAASFAEYYKVSSAERLAKKFLGSGETGPYRYLSFEQFRKLSVEGQQEQRRAFLKLSPAEQNRVRSMDLPIAADFGCVSWDEKPQEFFSTLSEQKLHELDLRLFLLPYMNQATYALKYPMVRAVNLNFSAIGANKNSLMLVALKSGRAPAMYALERKDCPRILRQGLFADVTEFLEDWEQAKNFPIGPMNDATYMGRVYGIPSRNLQVDALMYRRDWLKEPTLRAWCTKKGWLHPSDGEPYIPIRWTYDEFAELVKLIKDSDPEGKRKGYVDRPSSMLYLDAHGFMHSFLPEYTVFVGGKTTWRFNRENPHFINGMKKVHDMVWEDRAIRTGVEVNYTSAQEDFFGGRAGIAYTSSNIVLTRTLTSKYSIFGHKTTFADVVGLTAIPGSKEEPQPLLADCALIGFSPKLSREQLGAAVEWIKSLTYGEFVDNSLFFEVREARLLGTESLVLRNALGSVYDIDFSELTTDFRSVFSPIMVDFYDTLRAVQKRTAHIARVPKPEQFGLQSLPQRAIQDQVSLMFEKTMMDSLPNYEKILAVSEGYINSTLLNYKNENDVEKRANYLKALMAHFGKDTVEILGKINYNKAKSLYDQLAKEHGL